MEHLGLDPSDPAPALPDEAPVGRSEVAVIRPSKVARYAKRTFRINI